MTKSTLMTKSSKACTLVEGDEGFETAAILASSSPLGITSMGTFPLSLIALGQIRRRDFDEPSPCDLKKNKEFHRRARIATEDRNCRAHRTNRDNPGPAHDRTRESRNMEPPNIYSRSPCSTLK
jgi:hypothetical protein